MVALSATIVAAHTTTITKADPAVDSTVTQSPAQVTVQFSEEVVSQGSTMKVLDASGKQVSEGDGKLDLNDPNHQIMLATLPNALPDGVYTVAYHVLLTDGDATDDSYKFTVKSTGDPAAQQATATIVPTAAATVVPTVAPTTAPTLQPPRRPRLERRRRLQRNRRPGDAERTSHDRRRGWSVYVASGGPGPRSARIGSDRQPAA